VENFFGDEGDANFSFSRRQRRKVLDAVVVGADRVAANGDAANKIGTYQLAVLARYHGVPFYVVCPTSTLDLSAKSGGDIPIEERPGKEVMAFYAEKHGTAEGGFHGISLYICLILLL